jgi:general secretion pathway protein K
MVAKAGHTKGSALLAVLWLSVALAAIAFSLASTVRGELERTSTAWDGARAYYLATGALDRALIYMQWGPRFPLPDGSSRYFSPWTNQLHFVFPSGEASVDIRPESARLSLNSSSPQDLVRLLAALGAPPPLAAEIAAAILDWRTVPPAGQLTEFDRHYLSLTPSFGARHASFQEVEELLLVRGITPELYYGSLERDPQGRLTPRAGLADCVTVYGGGAQVDANTAPPAVLAAVGLGPQGVEAILQARRVQPFRSIEQLRALGFPAALLARLGIGGGRVYTLQATARLRAADGRLSDLRRSTGATVMLGDSGSGAGYQVLRWHDRIWEQDGQWTQDRSLQ